MRVLEPDFTPAHNGAMRVRGLILQASYRIHGGVPVVHLYGRLESGETFLVRDHRQRPHFYIGAADAARARTVASVEPIPTDRSNFAGAAVSRIETAVPGDVPGVRDRLHAAGIDTYEADVRFATRLLIDHDIKGGCEIDGERPAAPRTVQPIDWIFDDPVLLPADVDVRPSVLSFDIETDATATRLLAIALYGCGADEVLVVDPDGRPMPEHASAFARRTRGARRVLPRVAELDPDVLTGWNVVDFDLTVLARIAAARAPPVRARARRRARCACGRRSGYFGSGSASIPGRVVLDGIDLLRGAFVRMDDYSLDAVARDVLGEGKALEGDVHDRVGEILRRYQDDLAGFARYARTDARLALEIGEQAEAVRARVRAQPAHRHDAGSRRGEHRVVRLPVPRRTLHRRGIVAPTRAQSTIRACTSRKAAVTCSNRSTGVHESCGCSTSRACTRASSARSTSIRSAYVAKLRTRRTTDHRVESGAHFAREPAILPRLLDELFPRREAAKRRGDAVASQAIKILMNSFYGVLGTPACRFHNPALANAITGQGRHLLLWSKAVVRDARLRRCLYGDTDSLFVAVEVARSDRCGARRPVRARGASERATSAQYIVDRWRVESRLELAVREAVREAVPAVDAARLGRRAQTLRGPRPRRGPRKHRVRRHGSGSPRLDRARQAGAARAVSAPVHRRARRSNTSRTSSSAYAAANSTTLLVYRKGLRKDVREYTASTPPHVAAARKSAADPGRLVAYVMTTAGPEPLDDLDAPARPRCTTSTKQIRPVAEPVLGALGLDFDRVIGDDRQIGLF